MLALTTGLCVSYSPTPVGLATTELAFPLLIDSAEHKAAAWQPSVSTKSLGGTYVEPPVVVDRANCHLHEQNPERLDMSQFCDGDGCWPGLWLLGAPLIAFGESCMRIDRAASAAWLLGC